MSAERRRARVLLSMGAALGVGLAARGLLSAPSPRAADDALRAFYLAHLDRFARPGRARIEAFYFAGTDAPAIARATSVRERLLVGASAGATSEPSPDSVPSGLVSPTRIADSLGRSVALAIEALPAGGVTATVPVDGGAWVARVVEREPARIPAFDEARDEVRAEWALARREGKP